VVKPSPIGIYGNDWHQWLASTKRIGGGSVAMDLDPDQDRCDALAKEAARTVTAGGTAKDLAA